MIYTFADCELDTQRVTLCRVDQTIPLRRKVFQVLTYLIEQRERVVSKQDLCDAVWPDQFISDSTLESTIRAVRSAVGDSGSSQQVIQTFVGHGYRFVAAIEGVPITGTDPVVEVDPIASLSPAVPTQLPTTGQSQATILVVDDEIMVIKRLEALLIPRDYKVVSAANGAEALQRVQQEQPDLVLLDVMMPIMDGFEVCRRLKEDAEMQLIPVVLMTALGEVEDRIKGLEAGADDFLTKPVHRDELLARIRTSLRLKQTIDHTVEAASRGPMDRAPLYLTLTRQGDTIAVDLAAPDPVAPRGQVEIAESLVTEIGGELARITALASAPEALSTPDASMLGDASDDVHAALQRLGGVIFSHFFPAPTRQRLTDAMPTDLFLRLDEQLVHVPWELAFDGHDFCMAKFCIGRQVLSPLASPALSSLVPKVSDVLKMLLIVDPTESWPAIMQETEQLWELLGACRNLDVSMVGGRQLRKIDLLLSLSEYDLVHYAGQIYVDASQPGRSGWVLHDAVLTASEFCQVTHPPLLVFANACQPGPATRLPSEVVYEAQASSLGSAFSLAGTQHYISTFCVVHDANSVAFAADFYRHFLEGEPVGTALATARQQARQEADRRDILWASCVHYGSPTFRLPNAIVPP